MPPETPARLIANPVSEERGMNVLSLFSGIGGLDLGLEQAGMTVVGQVEADPYCRAVLARHWPKVPRHDDIATAAAWWTELPGRPAVHLVAAGPPCQPVSVAGRRAGAADPRWLWPPTADVIAELGPSWVVVENVPGLHRRGLDVVLTDLARLGYATRTGVVSACAVGAPHTRTRLFVLAHPDRPRRCPWRQQQRGTPAPPSRRGHPRGVVDRHGGWTNEPDLGRVAYGVPDRVDRTRALGNAVVPQVAAHIGRLILGTEHRGGTR